jgi:signal transduction histidine kinase
MNMTLRSRMLLVALLPTTLVAAVLTAVFLARAIDNLEQGLQTRGTAISKQLAAAAEFGVFSGQRASLLALTGSAQRIDSNVRGAAIIDPQGVVMARSGDLDPAAWPPFGQINGHRRGADSLLFVEPITRSSLLVDDIYGGGDVQRAPAATILGHVAVEVSLKEIAVRSQRLIVLGAFVALLGSALGGWLALRIARGVTRPLLEASEVVARIGAGDMSARMAPGSAGALQSLASGINDMAGRIGVTQEDLRARVAETTLDLQREKDAAERATIAKSHFLAAASHDLRQPLHALGLFVSGLAQSSAAEREPKLVRQIQESVGSLQHLLNAILDVSRLDHGNVVPEMGNFAMTRLLDRLARTLAPAAEHRGLKFKLRPTSAWVRSDRELVERILLNLVGNALRYTRAGGILIGCRRRGDVLRVEVWDTGEGIAQGASEKIFEDYVQLANPERDQAKGLGLGLAICRRLAALLGIPIGVRSRPGQGSVFWIELPIAPPEAGATDATIEPSEIEQAVESARLAGTVLVVEGDSLVRAGMEQAIIGWGGHVVLAATRNEALHRCREGDKVPDLAICNVRLPGRVDGIEFAQDLKREFEHIGILLVSADTSEETREAARRAGFALLRKPVPPGRLRAALQQLLALR